MKYKLINEDIENKSLLDVIYGNRNLDEQMVYRLLNASKSDYRNPLDIFGMNRAIDFFKKIYKEDLVVGLLVDEDADGITSSCLLYQFLTNELKHPKENIRVFHHKKVKQHGLKTDIFEDMLNSDVDLFIIADSSTNDIDEQRQLIEKGKNVIILDHHNKEGNDFVEECCLVNNQLGDLSNKHLAGVGVTAKFIEALGYNIDKYTDLIAVGLIADAMEMTDIQNKAYVNEGLNNLNNSLIKEYFSDIKNPIIGSVSYNLANYINATIRFGTQEEKIMLWRAIIGEEETIEYKKRNGEIVEQTLQEAMKRMSSNIKSRQNNAVKKIFKEIEGYIYKNNLQNDKCIIVIDKKREEKGISGLVAQKLLSAFKRPIIVVRPDEENEDEMLGSVRSPIDLKNILNESGLVIFAQGHNRSCGVALVKENISKLRKYLNEYLKDYNTIDEEVTEVDYIFNAKDLQLEQVQQIGDMRNLWGKGIKEPKFIVKKLTIESNKIKYKKEGICYVATFTHDGITYKKEFCSKEVYEKMCRKDLLKVGRSITLDLTLLVEFKKSDNGKFYYASIRDFNSKKTSQVIF